MRKKDEYFYKIAEYKYLAENEPNKLLKLIKNENCSCFELVLAIEPCEYIKNKKKVILTLVPKINHIIPTIRENIIYILSKCVNNPYLKVGACKENH